MPYTVNGIGTTYCGTWNRQVQDGVCESCHRRGKLVSYETWHCICVIFIPIIPLGKKQILNYCPSCSRHRVMPYREWIKVRDKAINETASELSESPDDPDKAMGMHATLAAFQKHDEATQFAELIEQKFADIPRVQFYLAAWYERIGRSVVANRLFLRAFELAPDDLNIRRAALLTFVEQGDVDQAKSLIQPFLPGSENFDIGIFYSLATGFQKLGRHQEAVQTLRMLLDAAPGLKTDKTFRKALAVSEKALGVEQLTIPAEPFYRSGAFVAVMIGAAVVAVALLWNEFIAMNRRVTIVNGLKTPITVAVDGKAGVQVPAAGQTDVTLGEGSHAAEVTVPANQFPKVAFDFSTSWWERFIRRPVFIVDPTKSAAVVWEEATYVPRGEHAPQGRHELRLGEPLTVQKHVDYRFTEFPESITLDKKSGTVVKSRIAVLHEDVLDLVQHGQVLGASPTTMLPFIQTHLQQSPERDDLLPMYTYLCMQLHKATECCDFLSKRLEDRPVRVGWHRIYQSMLTQGVPPEEARKKHDELKRKYSELVEHEPDDASLLYLRGRLEGHGRNSWPYFEKSLALMPQHPYALYASGHSRLVNGDFDQARDLIGKAVEARPDDAQFKHNLVQAQFAAEDFPAMEKDARDELGRTPLSPTAMEKLLKVLVASNRAEEADRELAKYSETFQRIVPAQFNSLVQPLRLKLTSIKNEFPSLEQATANSQDPIARKYSFYAKLESNQLADVPTETVPSDGAYLNLCRELVATRLGDAEQAKISRTTALSLLDQGFDNDWAAADVLRQSADVSWEEVADLGCEPANKAVVLVVMARERADLRPKLLDLAEKLNFDLEFPHFLLAKEIADLRQK